MIKIFFLYMVMLSIFLCSSNLFAKNKDVQYFGSAYGDLTYIVIYEGRKQEFLKDGFKKTILFPLGAELCVNSKNGLLVLRDLEKVDHYLNYSSGCYTVQEANKPSMIQKIKQYIPPAVTNGEASSSGIIWFDSPTDSSLGAVSLSKNEANSYNLYKNKAGSLALIDRAWLTSSETLPIKLQVIDKYKNNIFQQLSRTQGFTYFSIPVNLLPRMNGAVIKVMNRSREILMYIKMKKDNRGDWVYVESSTS